MNMAFILYSIGNLFPRIYCTCQFIYLLVYLFPQYGAGGTFSLVRVYLPELELPGNEQFEKQNETLFL